MRRSVARRIKAGLIAFTIVDAGVLFLGVQRMHNAPRSVIGNSELAMQQFALPPLFNSVPNGAAKQDAALATGYAAPPALPVKSMGEGSVPEAEPVPVALLAAVPTDHEVLAQYLVSHSARRSHHASARRHVLPYQGSSAAPFPSAFDGAGSSPPPNPYYLPDPSPLTPDGQAGPVASGGDDAATDATATDSVPPAGDVAATVTQEPVRPQAELAPSATLGSNPDVSAAEQPSLPAAGPSPVVPATP